MACKTKAEIKSKLVRDLLKEIKEDNPQLPHEKAVELARDTAEHILTGEVVPDADKRTNAETIKIPYKTPVAKSEHMDPLTIALARGNDLLSHAFITAGEQAEGPTREALTYLHNFLKERETTGPLYTDAMDALTGIWNGSEQVQLIRQYTFPDKKFHYRLSNLRSIKQASHQDQIARIEKAEAEIGKRFDAKYKTDKERDLAYTTFAESALFGIANNGMLRRLTEENTSIDILITEAEASLGKDGPKLIQNAKDLSLLYTNSDLRGKNVQSNANGYGLTLGSKTLETVEALASLYSLKNTKGSVNMLVDLYKNDKELYTDMIMLSITAKAVSDKISNQVHLRSSKEYNSQRGNLIEDIGPEDHELRVVSAHDAEHDHLLSEEYGWKTLHKPGKNGELGIIYRENTEVIRGGIATNVGYMKTGINIPLKYTSNLDGDVVEGKIATLRKSNSVFARPNRKGTDAYAISLTSAQRKTLGYSKSPVTALIRSYAHNLMLLETQEIRNTLMDSFTVRFNRSDQIDLAIPSLIDSNDHPALIDVANWKVSDYDKLSKEVKDKYMLIDRSLLSNIGNFDSNAVLVRKDLGEGIFGYRQGGLFTNNHSANVHHKKLKDLIRWFKINNIVLNVPKIGIDIASGMSVASAKGASIRQMIDYTKEAYTGSKEVTALRNKRSDLMFKKAALPEGSKGYKTIEDQIAAINLEMYEHPFNPAYANGFIQSLGTQLIHQDGTSSKGLEATIEHTIRKYMVKEGKSTPLNDAIKKAANFGGKAFAIETLYGALGTLLDNKGSKSEAEVLNGFKSHMETIKNADDMSAYVAELIASPNSNLVKLGSAATVLADLIPRWVIYRHNIDKGMSEQAAVEDALLSLPDYKEELPSSLQFLSDLYVLPYPSFFVRITRVIGSLAIHTPVSVAGQMAWENYMGASFNMYGSDVFSKAYHGYLVSNPMDLVTAPYAQLDGF